MPRKTHTSPGVCTSRCFLDSKQRWSLLNVLSNCLHHWLALAAQSPRGWPVARLCGVDMPLGVLNPEMPSAGGGSASLLTSADAGRASTSAQAAAHVQHGQAAPLAVARQLSARSANAKVPFHALLALAVPSFSARNWGLLEPPGALVGVALSQRKKAAMPALQRAARDEPRVTKPEPISDDEDAVRAKLVALVLALGSWGWV